MNNEFDCPATCNYKNPACDSMTTEMWNQLKEWEVESETMASECRDASVSVSNGDVSKRSSGKRKRDHSPDECESQAKVPRYNTYHSDRRPYYSRSGYHFSRIPEHYPSRHAKVYVNKNHPNFHKYFH